MVEPSETYRLQRRAKATGLATAQPILWVGQLEMFARLT
jgi:hypothetical protein